MLPSALTASPGTLLCWMVLPYLVAHAVYVITARRPVEGRALVLAADLVLAAGFAGLASLGNGEPWRDGPGLLLARLWLPIIFFWWSYVWSGKVLHVYHPPEFNYDRPVLAIESRFGQPSLWLARDRPRWLNEAMNFFYFSYYFYTPVLVVVLYGAGRLQEFEALALAVNLGYAVCYSAYPFTPVWGPRWALVDEGMLPRGERILEGYAITRFMNSIMWGDIPHKGGAMPSAHSSTAFIFLVWCGRIWGGPGWVAGVAIAGTMFVSTVYGRYHYVVDVLVGIVIGVVCLGVADFLVPAP